MQWSKQEDETLKQNYAIIDNAELCALFPGRKLDAIRYHARQLGLVREKKVYRSGENVGKKRGWTKEGEELLKTHYETSSMDELLALFPGKTPMAIYGRAFQLRLKRQPLHDTEERRMRVKARIEEGITQAEIARLENVSLSAISTDVAMMGIQKRNRPKVESDDPENESSPDNDKKIEEIKEKLRQRMARKVIVEKKPIVLKSWEKRIICDFGRSMGLAELKSLLPRRSRAEILDAARFFGIEIQK